jgi:cation transport regulator ChaB
MKKLFLAHGTVAQHEYMGESRTYPLLRIVWADDAEAAFDAVRHEYEKDNEANFHSGTVYYAEGLVVTEVIGSPE